MAAAELEALTRTGVEVLLAATKDADARVPACSWLVLGMRTNEARFGLLAHANRGIAHPDPRPRLQASERPGPKMDASRAEVVSLG